MKQKEKQAALAQKIYQSTPAKGDIDFWWLGQSGFIFKTSNICFGVDLYLSTYLEETTKDQSWNYHERMMPIPTLPEMIQGLDYLLITHNHGDHYDTRSVKGLMKQNPNLHIIAPRSMEKRLKDDGFTSLILVSDKDVYTCLGFSLRALKAKHNAFDYSSTFGYPYLSYVITCEGKKICIAGDTILYDGMIPLLRSFSLDLAFLPINGFTEELIANGFQSNLTYKEAVSLAKEAEIKMVVPCHYDMFTINTEQVGTFVNEANAQGLCGKYTIPTIDDSL